MAFYILRPIEGLLENDNLWEPWFDKCFGFIVKADDEIEARQIAHSDAGDENRGEFMSATIANTKQHWLDEKYSTCRLLIDDDFENGVVMRDFASI